MTKTEREMNCVCGHRDRDHVASGRCRVPDCPCEHYQPGDTLRLPPSWRWTGGSFQ